MRTQAPFTYKTAEIASNKWNYKELAETDPERIRIEQIFSRIQPLSHQKDLTTTAPQRMTGKKYPKRGGEPA
jgi:hypothetical protein